MSTEKNSPVQRDISTVFNNLGYEVLPFKNTAENTLKWIPKSTRLTVTASPPKGIEATIALTERLAGEGYDVAPHLSARMISDKAQLSDIVDRMKAAGVEEVFVVGGDAKEAAGEFHDGLDLLRALAENGHHFKEIGIGGYPEGHAFISRQSLASSLREKSELATYVATQICFDAKAIVSWARSVKADGVELPIRVGMPGAVTRQKLLRISLASGVGDSVNFLKKQQNMFWRFFVPGGYSPNKLVSELKPFIGQPDNNIADFHIFTFNELEKTEAWRQKSLTRFSK